MNHDLCSRWGDRGVVVGHLWEPSQVPTARLPQRDSNSNYPGWVEKSPNRMMEGNLSQSTPYLNLSGTGDGIGIESRLTPYRIQSYDTLVEAGQQSYSNPTTEK